MKATGQSGTNPWLCGASMPALVGGLAIALLLNAQAQGQPDPSGCGKLSPFGDYLVDKDKVAMSDAVHFTPEVEALIRGKSSNVIGADIDFMLRNYPNHHRALISMMKLGEKVKSPQPPGAMYTVECYFIRAIRFRSDDIVARLLYATYLTRNGREADATAQLEQAAKGAPDNPFSQYNIGLLYFDLKRYDRALEQAHKAMALGFPRQELKQKLVSAGQWQEPAPSASGVAAPSPASAASAQ
jgi:tetratricopeptide (TPR) repeat protein